MNSAISNLRPYGSQIVKLILFFYSDGTFFFFLVFLISLSFFPVSHSCSKPPTIYVLSLSLSLSLPTRRLCLPLRRKPSRSIKPSRSLSQWFFFFFFVCDLMVDSAVVVWIMDLAFWVISRLGFQFGHILVGL